MPKKAKKQAPDWESLLYGAVKAPMPEAIIPMMGTLVDKPFDRKGWLFEVKWDGYRVIAKKNGGQVTLWSRNRRLFKCFPDIEERLKGFTQKEMILDGEAVLFNEKGMPDFQLMQNYQTERKGDLIYYVFDLLYLNGFDLRELPLIRRKTILQAVLHEQNDDVVRFSDSWDEHGIDFFSKVQELGMEGIIAKDINSPYLMKRSQYWLKMKTKQRQEFVIGGYSPPSGSRKMFGSLLVGFYDNDALIYAGRVGGGFTDRSLLDVYQKLEKLIVKKSPFDPPPKEKNITWLKPELVCEVEFAEWTSDGLLRQPVFKGLRFDKKPKNIIKEKAAEV